MLPATKSHRFSLADVMPSCLASVMGQGNSLSLPPVDKAVVLLLDGLGAAMLRSRAGHARTLAPRLDRASVVSAGFPTTTAASLATLMTGQPPGSHGLVGYTVLDPENARVVNQLSGWDERLDPATWQRCSTVFQRAGEVGVDSVAIGLERFRHSGLTAAVLRGAEYRSGVSISDRLAEARRVLDSHDKVIVYVYAPELDKAAHASGWQSESWTAQLENADAAAAQFIRSLRRREGLLVTADHGVLDVPASHHVVFGSDAAQLDGIRFVAGEPRCLQLHFEPDAGAALRSRVLERWQAEEGDRAWVVDRDTAVAAEWFGPEVDAAVLPRIGDILVAARKRVAYYDERADAKGRRMIGQHGSFSSEEVAVPLLRFGAFSR